jgi:hypothetical protein
MGSKYTVLLTQIVLPSPGLEQDRTVSLVSKEGTDDLRSQTLQIPLFGWVVWFNALNMAESNYQWSGENGWHDCDISMVLFPPH